MPIRHVPRDTPILDSDGNLTRTWFLFFQQVPDSTTTTIITGGGGSGPDVYFDDTIIADVVTIDLADGLVRRIVLNQATPITIAPPIWTAGTITAGSKFSLY